MAAVNMLSRERRSWTAKEDQLLREAVQREDPGNPNPSKWHAIAKHVPDRTNKDCRKRWFAKMASDVVKGGWAPDEDERLVKAIERYGTRWSLVASLVQTRNSDQCAKRWTDTLNPSIDRTTWTPEGDALLISAVNEHGKLWTKIVKTYFPGRTGLSAKNRYNSITRFNSDRGGRKSSVSSYTTHRSSHSESASSSASVSPITPSIPIPEVPNSLFSKSPTDSPIPFSLDQSSWEEPSFGPLSTYGSSRSQSGSRVAGSGFNSFENSVNQNVPPFHEDSLLAFQPTSYDPSFSSQLPDGQVSSYDIASSESLRAGPTLPHFGAISASFDNIIGEHWASTTQVYDPNHWERYRVPPAGGASSPYLY
ncbi:uncharacterized protein EV420DRAFT_29934 [Desarmillaria tabescens]|uniref:Uncharacterized protein n=1 Tax=Armillaria tabescens TaxID=1929756 RepID=A0AA39NPG0_ARMTA|nr:uncharacterized protein EV420DRAFT_29934 [Desarmillaria tabescens]KAK0469405.1 hypothetical protein EV420DRAFT_29934 [Desarmillaria tabescens]